MANFLESHLSRIAFAVVVLTFYVLPTCNSSNLAEELRVTREQKAAMDKLKQRISPHITEGWMKEDLNLVRFLRVSDFNVERAQRKMMETIKWRKDLKMAKIHLEEYPDMLEEFPYIITRDREGEPTVIIFVGEWDLRNAVITGRAERLSRYAFQGLETAARLVREMQRQGQNVTQFNIILDVGGFNLVQHTCVVCVVRILEIVINYDLHYPGFMDRIIAVNTPPSVAALVESVRGVANPVSFSKLKVYGHDRNVWRKKLLQFIDQKNLPVELGGTLSRN